MSELLLIVDVQNEWADSNPDTTGAIDAAVYDLRDVMPVLWVYTSCEDVCDRPERIRQQPVPRFNIHANGLYDPVIQPRPGDWVAGKDGNSAFTNPEILEFLHNHGVETLYVAGFRATDCVYDTACHAGENGFEAVIVSDLTADDYDDEIEEEPFRDAGIAIKTSSSLVGG